MTIGTKIKLGLVSVIVVAIVIAALYLRYGGVTHQQIVDVVDARADSIEAKIDDRYERLDQKLDSIESKLDRILEIAVRPLTDGLQEVK